MEKGHILPILGQWLSIYDTHNRGKMMVPTPAQTHDRQNYFDIDTIPSDIPDQLLTPPKSILSL